jgi:hypothetical protein
MPRTLTRLILSLVWLASLFTTVLADQRMLPPLPVVGGGRPDAGPLWHVADPLSETDRRDILQLLARLGIAAPESVRYERIAFQALGCRQVRVKSKPDISGSRLAWNTVRLTRRDWLGPECPGPIPSASIFVGGWLVLPGERVRQVSAWRIGLSPQQWPPFVDVETPPDVPHGDAASIVKAFWAHSWIDRRSGASGPWIDDAISGARLVESIVKTTSSPPTYNVRLAIGTSADVVIASGQVELRDATRVVF